MLSGIGWVILAYAVITVGLIVLVWRIKLWLWKGEPQHAEQQEKCSHIWGRAAWSQDGWIRVCPVCKLWSYGGEDYEGGPIFND
jgi:hypothetical protein